MKKAVKCALFIDDDKATNYIHKFIANKLSCFECVEIVSSAKEGLEYLKNAEIGENRVPDFIFLDINMPAMNGWDFLNNINEQSLTIKNKVKIFMLSSSSRSTDINKAKQYKLVSGFITKPLTENVLNDVVVERNSFEFKQ